MQFNVRHILRDLQLKAVYLQSHFGSVSWKIISAGQAGLLQQRKEEDPEALLLVFDQ
jgi:hypothetical protein